MLFLGLVLLAATGTLTGLLIAGNLGGGPDYTVALLGHDLITMNSLSIFCAGLALALVACLSLLMAGEGAALRRRKAVRLREARNDADAAVAERDALAARVERQRTEDDHPARTSAPEMPLQQPRKHRAPHAFGS
ncbi:hypothetical protein [Streptomyces sp. RKAG293]|uniref:hypothetical protein n=1 Tax=Streptomyces sp. RKAG293 TaxID=2893403 RepID=UPI002033310B|nr:hypothetical protein [Streptomyces sp. RKAG293]MCM2419880.1 hypothetical protein [Streptomyces sp. RKAG293]